MYDLDYARPATLREALALLKTEEAMPLSGGQSLIPVLKQRLAQPSLLVDLSGIDSLKTISLAPDHFEIGAGATHAEVAAHPELGAAIPALASLAARIGDPQVRHLGTLGGSLANNDPAACYPGAALALGATIVTDRREIGAAEFFEGLYTTALEAGEVVTAARFPRPEAASYQKFEQPASRFALTGVFLARLPGAVRVAVVGAGEDGVFRSEPLETALTRDFSPEAAMAVAVPEAGLMTDLHAAPDYRAHLIKTLTRRAVEACLNAAG